MELEHTDLKKPEAPEILCHGASATDSREYYHSSRRCNKMSPGCCGLSADNRVPEGGLADGGGGAFLSRGGRQKAEAGELLSQSHSEENRQVSVSRIRLLDRHVNRH